jgi:tetratricopeptide (TPR) repeat protein
MALCRLSLLAIVLAAFWLTPQRAPATDAPLPPMAGLSEPAAAERAALFAALAATKDDGQARAVEERLWTSWRGRGDARSLALLKTAEAAQIEFDYGHALEALYDMVKHQPDFAEGWNRLAYALFLANSYDAALDALEKAIALEPMHYAALAGKGVILIRQGNDADGVAALKRALAIDPWLKERNLIGNPSAIRP